MTISAISSSLPSPSIASSSSFNAASTAPTVDYTQFLQLLVAELQNQDPTDPTQYMSQLASFSTVEQQVQTNATLDALLSAQASNIIGKTVTSADGTTTGVVASVELSTGGGAIAILSNGSQVTLGPGVTVSGS